MKFILPILFLLAACNKLEVKQQSIPKGLEIEHDKDFVPPGGFNTKGSRLLNLKDQVEKDNEAYRRGGGGNKGPDTDKDGIINKYDNCPADYNPLQEDADRDGIGDICDGFTDADFDGIEDRIDNCIGTYNPTQSDCDRDGKGDACDTDICTPNPETVYEHVIFLDFDGHYVTENGWIPYNGGQPFYVSGSGLTPQEIQKVIDTVKEDFKAWKVTITTDSNVYNAAAPYKKQRVIITQDHEWYGLAGGVAYINSMVNSVQPAFVFSKALSYNAGYVGEASSHESGHTVNLRHQRLYGDSCNLIYTYNPGANGVAPIMGVSYGKHGIWWTGYSTCTTIQDDKYIIGLRFPLK